MIRARLRFLSPCRDTRHMLLTLALSSPSVGLGLLLVLLAGVVGVMW